MKDDFIFGVLFDNAYSVQKIIKNTSDFPQLTAGSDIRESITCLYGLEGIIQKIFKSTLNSFVFENINLNKKDFNLHLSREGAFGKIIFYDNEFYILEREIETREQIQKNLYHWTRQANKIKPKVDSAYLKTYVDGVSLAVSSAIEVEDTNHENSFVLTASMFNFLKKITESSKNYINLKKKTYL
jgi:uncharacterized protein YsxB (DUF464 family)